MSFLTANGALVPFYTGLAHAAWLTIFVSVVAFAIGLVIGSLLFLLRANGAIPFKLLVRLYISLMRGTPLLVQILIAYYVIPSALDMDLSAVTAGILALSMNTSAYISEVLRGAFSSLPRGQVSAADALGMHWATKWLHVILPQVFQRSLPPLTNEFTILLKASSLLSIISVPELSALARDVNLQSNLPLQVFIASAAAYFVILFAASSISRLIEANIKMRLPNAR